jgi:hypothetical protein
MLGIDTVPAACAGQAGKDRRRTGCLPGTTDPPKPNDAIAQVRHEKEP